MLEVIEMLKPVILELLVAVITAVAGYVGAKLKALYEEKVNTEIKEKVVKTAVNAVEQLYKDLKGEDKLNKCIESSTAMLSEKGISITELELRMLIESAVNAFNAGAKKEE